MSMFGRGDTVTQTFKGKDELSPVVRGIRSTMDQFKRDAATGFGLAAGINVFSAATMAIGKVTDYIGDAVNMASDWEEANSKVGVVFGEMSDEIRAFANSSASSLGISERAALSTLGTFGNLFDALGTGTEESAQMSQGLVQLAADLASFNNADVQDVIVALQSGLVGETEPMRRFGANLSAARVEAWALTNGLARTKAEITDSMKVTARYALIMEDTKNAQGDFARTSDGLANSQRTLSAELDNISTDIGKALLPVVKDLAIWTRDNLVPAIYDLMKVAGELGELFNQLNRTINPSVGVMQDLTAAVHKMGAEYGLTAEESQRLLDENMALQQSFAAGMTPAREMEIRLAQIHKAMLALPGPTNRYGSVLLSILDPFGRVKEAASEVAAVLTGPDGPAAATERTVRRMFQTMDQAKEPWRAAWQQLQAWAKHPFRPDAFENWIAGRVDAALEKAQKAQDRGRPGIARRQRRIAALLTSPIIQAELRIGASIEEAMATLEALQASAIETMGSIEGLFDSGSPMGGGIEIKPKPKKNKNRNKRASGGPVSAGETYLVGEQGPELLHMGNRSGSITPNHAIGSGGPINVYVDGERLFRIMDARQGRAVAMGG